MSDEIATSNEQKAPETSKTNAPAAASSDAAAAAAAAAAPADAKPGDAQPAGQLPDQGPPEPHLRGLVRGDHAPDAERPQEEAHDQVRGRGWVGLRRSFQVRCARVVKRGGRGNGR